MLYLRKFVKISFDNRKYRGFTLIELLVVISIIGVLAAMVLIGLRTVRGKAQDVQRKADLRSIARALEAYSAEHGDNYPKSSSNDADCNAGGVEKLTDTSCAGVALINSGQIGMTIDSKKLSIGGILKAYAATKIPQDKIWTDEYKNYHYLSNGDTYSLEAKLATGNRTYYRFVSQSNEYVAKATSLASEAGELTWPGGALLSISGPRDSLRLVWPAAIGTADDMPIQYKIQYRENVDGSPWQSSSDDVTNVNGTQTAPWYVERDLLMVSYKFRVTATNRNNTKPSIYLENVIDFQDNNPPTWEAGTGTPYFTNDTVAGSTNHVKLNWGYAKDDNYRITSFRVDYQRTSPPGGTLQSITAYPYQVGNWNVAKYRGTIDTDFQAGTYNFKVYALDLGRNLSAVPLTLNDVVIEGDENLDLAPPLFLNPTFSLVHHLSADPGGAWVAGDWVLTWDPATDVSGILRYEYVSIYGGSRPIVLSSVTTFTNSFSSCLCLDDGPPTVGQAYSVGATAVDNSPRRNSTNVWTSVMATEVP